MYEGENLGLILRRMKLIDKETLIKALKYQKVKGGRLGEILVRTKAITDKEVLTGHTPHPDFEWNWFQHAPQVMPQVLVCNTG